MNHYRAALITLAALALRPIALDAQRAALYEQVALRAPYVGAFREQSDAGSRLLNAGDLARLQLYDRLRDADIPVARRDETFARYLITDLFAHAPRVAITRTGGGEPFRQIAPEAQAMLTWTSAFRSHLYDLLAQGELASGDQQGRMVELLGYYRSRRVLAISAAPKDVGRLNARLGATAFRASHPRANGALWAYDWLELALLESLATGRTATERSARASRAIARFGQMLGGAPQTAPFLMPVSSAVAPTFAARFPDAAGILDNTHLLQDYIADVMTAKEIPRSAHRQEIARALNLFRSDTAATATYAQWIDAAAVMGLENMGGAAVGFGDTLPRPTIERGASLAVPTDPMPGMDHGGMAGMPGQDTSSLKGILDRMLSDPVIRERVATDPVLQRMLARTGMGGASPAMGGMVGMDHNATNMPGANAAPAAPMSGMDHTHVPMPPRSAMRMSGMNMAADSAQRVKNDFIRQLLTDATVEARIQADPQLRRLWADPEVQRRLRELRAGARAQPGPVTPDTTRPRPPSPHQH